MSLWKRFAAWVGDHIPLACVLLMLASLLIWGSIRFWWLARTGEHLPSFRRP